MAFSARSLAVLVSAAVPPSAPEGAPAAPPPLAIVHVHVVPMDREIVLKDQVVLVEGGRIAAVGPAGDVEVPAGAQVVDGAGQWLIPGLADMHVHLWATSDCALFLANGVTTVRNMFGSALQLQWRREIESGERLGPRIYTAGPIIDGSPPIWPGSTVVTDPAAADAVVLAQKAAGYDFIKVYSNLTAEAHAALLKAATRHGMRAMGHVPMAVPIGDAIAGGQASCEHLTGLLEACQRDGSPLFGKVSMRNAPEAWKFCDESKVAAVAESAAAGGLWNCPTLVVLQKWAKGGDADALLARPEMRFVAPSVKASWASPAMYLARMPDEFIAANRAAGADRLRAVRLLHEAGAPLLAGTDLGNPYVVAGWSLHEELANLVAAGLSPYEALRAATADAAKFMGAAGEWGTIEVGARADLVLLDGDPLADVGAAGTPSGVVVRGRWLPAAELAHMLEDVASSFGDGAGPDQGGEDDGD